MGDWGFGGVPKPSDRTGSEQANSSTGRNNNNEKNDNRKDELITTQMQNLQKYKEKYANLNYGQALQLLSDTEEQRNRELPEGYRKFNLNEFLQQKGVSSDPNVPVLAFQAQTLQDVQVAKPIDLSTITSSDQLRSSQKATAEREFLKNQYNVTNIPVATPEEKEEITARKMGFGGGGAGVANLGYGTITTPKPQNFTELVYGRINTPIEPIIAEPEVIEETKTHSADYKKIALIGVGIFAVLALIILRMKK